ncbi:MAG: CotH kinase family protein [Flavobacteriales bacterium]|nr:CotH kinase family protein [Flavobacteriales bacterium]
MSLPFHLFVRILPLLLFTPAALAQNLPMDMHFSVDGRILYTGGLPSTGFYAEDSVKTIHLQFPQSNYWSLLQSNYATKTPIPAALTFDGVTYDSVGVRFKGQTSFAMLPPTSQKRSFDIDVDTWIDQKLQGYESLNLNNCFQDNSFLREVSYLHLIRRHIPAAKANYVKLMINGANWGVYANVQGLSGEFLKEWYFSNNGTRWRADRPDGGFGGSWGDGTAALNYLGMDTTTYKTYYTLKKTNKTQPWDELVAVCNKLNNTSTAQLEDTVRKYMDLDRTLWYLATEIAFSDDDSYVHKGKMDYYLYWDPETQRMTPIEYDGNSVMMQNAINWSAFYNVSNANYPLLNKLLNVPSIRQRYLAHLRTIIQELLIDANPQALLGDYKALIDTMIQNDPKKLMTYAQFNTAVTSLQGLYTTRKNNLLANTEVAQVGPTIGAVDHVTAAGLNGAPTQSESPTVRAVVSSGSGIYSVKLFWATGLTGNFTSTPMFDDGLHDDGAAGDGVFGASIPALFAGTWVRYYVEAAANNAARTVSYAPPGAEHDIFIYRVAVPAVPVASVVVNEIMASNLSTVVDDAGQYEDWIELHNPGTSPVDMGLWFVSDTYNNPYKWRIPVGTVIPPNGYLILWADEDESEGLYHTNFKLSGSGEEVLLVSADSLLVDHVVFGAQVTDMGYARVPNGFGPFVIQPPTFNANNSPGMGVDEAASNDTVFRVYPNPTNGLVTFLVSGTEQVTALDATGRVVWSGPVNMHSTVDAQAWGTGTYVLRTDRGQVQRLVVMQ